jgi:hypothetical protein
MELIKAYCNVEQFESIILSGLGENNELKKKLSVYDTLVISKHICFP